MELGGVCINANKGSIEENGLFEWYNPQRSILSEILLCNFFIFSRKILPWLAIII